MTRCKDDAEARYERIRQLSAKQESAAGKAVLVLRPLLAACGGAAGYVFRGTYPYALAGGAAFCALLSAGFIAVLTARIRRGALLEAESGELSACLERYAGTREITQESMKKLHEALNGFLSLCASVTESGQTLAAYEEQTRALEAERLQYQEELTRQEQIRSGVEQKLMELAALRTQETELSGIIAENERKMREADAIELAIENISELADLMRDSAGPYLNREAGRLLSEMTDGAYTGLDAGDGRDIYLSARGRMVPIGTVSAGTMDQVYLAIRMAAARQICRKRESLPLIMDDSFALYDDERLRRALTFASSEHKGQLLIFTCHHREARLLSEAGIPYKLQELA